MASTDDQAKAVIVLDMGERAVPLGSIDPATRCDLALIDDILRLRLAATRLGWSIRLTDVDRDLRELVELVGLSDCLGI
jgi:hypothetical protein